MAKLSIVKVKLDREVNCYVLSDATSKEAVVIDPGMPIEKIDRTLGIQINAAKHTIFRAVRKLREALEPFVRSTPCNT